MLAYKRDICDGTKDIDCAKSRENTKSNGFFVDLNVFRNSEKMLYIYVAIGGILIISICLLFVVFMRRCTRNRKQMDERPMRDVMMTENVYQPQRRLSISDGTQFTTIPENDLRHRARDAFSASDLTVIRQTLQLMKKKYPREIYDQVYNNTMKLMGGDLTETEKVFTIDEIVRSLLECENTDTDFVAFTGILYKHLGAPPDGTAPPMYEEAIGLRPAEDGTGEHIYAEPGTVAQQQPLLHNEYTMPIDQNDNVSHLYTEPIARDIGEDLFCRKCSTLMNSINRKYANDVLLNEVCSCQAKLDDLYANFIYTNWCGVARVFLYLHTIIHTITCTINITLHMNECYREHEIFIQNVTLTENCRNNFICT